MTDSITPPPELVQQWRKEPQYTDGNKLVTMVTMTTDRLMQLCEKSAQHGADQELEACLANIHTMYGKDKADWLRAIRRPKPLSLKEQALAELAEWENVMDIASDSPIRRALEALPE
jgi:hypothetical protein